MYLAPVGVWVMPLVETSNCSRRMGADICLFLAFRTKVRGIGLALSPTGRLLGSIDSLNAGETELSTSNPHPGSRPIHFIKPFHDELRR